MGDLIRHGLPCKSCSSSDAVAEYSENYYCFSCETSFPKAPSKKSNTEKISFDAHYIIPTYSEFSEEAKNYLKSYGISRKDCENYKIKFTNNFYIYSKKSKKYINMGPRIVYQYGLQPFDLEGRTLDSNDKIKYITIGEKETLFKTFNNKVDVAVITEDILSAIKVGKVLPTIALRGTKLSRQQAKTMLMLISRKIIFWLDSDEAGRRAVDKLVDLFQGEREIEIITSTYDPKCYTKEAIRKRLG